MPEWQSVDFLFQLTDEEIGNRLEQNHNFHAHNSLIKGVDFLRKSTLWSRSLGYTYCGFAIAFSKGVVDNKAIESYIFLAIHYNWTWVADEKSLFL
jgi:hypothetical protein